MGRSAEVAISLPEDVLRAVGTERQSRGESRSQFFRRAVEKLLTEERQTSAIQDYIHGYREVPELVRKVRYERTMDGMEKGLRTCNASPLILSGLKFPRMLWLFRKRQRQDKQQESILGSV